MIEKKVITREEKLKKKTRIKRKKCDMSKI